MVVFSERMWVPRDWSSEYHWSARTWEGPCQVLWLQAQSPSLANPEGKGDLPSGSGELADQRKP